MTQLPKSRYVFWGIRVIALSVTLVLACRAYKSDRYIGLAGISCAVVLGALTSYPMRQGEKLAAENMRRYGLNPDRDEAQPARKAIDNRSMEI
jgi:hypothetical protein